jgi:hypothetical protein
MEPATIGFAKIDSKTIDLATMDPQTRAPQYGYH